MLMELDAFDALIVSNDFDAFDAEADVAPIIVVGGAALALIAAFGGAAAAARWSCGSRGVQSWSMRYFPTPRLSVTCRR
jgi:hypothetical protein